MEKRDLYDFEKKKTGESIFENEKIPKNRYILVVTALIQNSEGKFLIQKRSKKKGGTYALTAGHPIKGENSIEGIQREIKEELGLEILEKELELWTTEKEKSLQCFFDLYYCKKDFEISSLVIQKEEVESAQWKTLEEIQQICKDNKFKKEHQEALELLLQLQRKKQKY